MQKSQWFTNQSEDIVSYDLTITPHALHNSLEFSYITYMLHSHISYLIDIKANIWMQSVSCSAFLYIKINIVDWNRTIETVWLSS